MCSSDLTDWGRNCIGADMWVNAFCRINAGEKCVVSDVRFENEAALVRANGILIHVTGRGGIGGSHVSESGVAILDSDIVLDNSGALDELRLQIKMWDFSRLVHELGVQRRFVFCGEAVSSMARYDEACSGQFTR